MKQITAAGRPYFGSSDFHRALMDLDVTLIFAGQILILDDPKELIAFELADTYHPFHVGPLAVERGSGLSLQRRRVVNLAAYIPIERCRLPNSIDVEFYKTFSRL